MSGITVIKNPLGKDENLVFALNDHGSLQMLNATPFSMAKANTATVEEGPAVVPSSLTSCLYRNMICVFGLVDARTPHTIAMLSPVYTRFPEHTSNDVCISSTVSCDGQDCWIYYRDTAGNIMQLSLSNRQLTRVVENSNITARTKLAAFMDSTETPQVIYQGKGNEICVCDGPGSHSKIADTESAEDNTRISVTTSNLGGVEIVYVYYIGPGKLLNLLKRKSGKWSAPKSLHNLGRFDEYQFAVIHGGKEENEIYFLNSDLEIKTSIDRH